MQNIKLLSHILKRTNKLIISNEFKEAYSLGNSFSRKRKLTYAPTQIAIRNERIGNEKYRNYYLKEPFIRIAFESHISSDTVEIELISGSGTISKLLLKTEEKFYIQSIYCLLNGDCTVLPAIFGCNVDKKYVYKRGEISNI